MIHAYMYVYSKVTVINSNNFNYSKVLFTIFNVMSSTLNVNVDIKVNDSAIQISVALIKLNTTCIQKLKNELNLLNKHPGHKKRLKHIIKY
jgi:hypothetical protein